MSLLQKERDVITRNEYADSFDFDEIEDFIRNANKEMFISHHLKNEIVFLFNLVVVSRPIKRCLNFMKSL